ncbi:hypothetical protein FSARC_12631 [Fusarium sarcochroum]|uniref:Epoxide hydrolase N-terminal domain-containing protein n=1 Tax=Fusarium sarcochroum TaxID=1208366 RepID=A0A8H4T6V8_9HYPO|nr:hypothetical protein FSARC_12631 [Fusarium sarcochroum]
MSLNFNFPANTTAPVPFTISVNETFISQTIAKAGLYRPSIDLLDESNANWIEGPPRANMSALADYWANDYDWFTEQDYINGNFSHFAITVPETPKWKHPTPLHFIHERADDDDALPLLLLHGWPSTSQEWRKVIEPLVSPLDPALSGHHVVAPDLPGFGFSPAPEYSGLSPVALAGVLDAFMAQLGYDKYGVVSTDLGWWVGMWMVDAVPKGRIAGHFCDFFLVPPNSTDLERYQKNETTAAETKYIASNQAWYNEHTGYQHVQTQQPLSIGQAMADSPVGFAGWIWQLMFSVSDGYPYTFDEIITTALTLFIQGPWGNMRYYKELFTPEAMNFPQTKIPTGVSQWAIGDENVPFPELANFNFVPKDWIERLANVRKIYRHDAGGHFPAVNLPQDWTADVLDFFSHYVQ